MLANRLSSNGVLLNVHAETLLDSVVFNDRDARTVVVTELTIGDLGLLDGATLPEILATARI